MKQSNYSLIHLIAIIRLYKSYRIGKICFGTNCHFIYFGPSPAAFSFDLNPAGVQRDAVKSMGAGGREQDDLSWDPVWEARATKDEGGWTAEYRIPFSQLRFGEEEEPVWGIQIERVIGRRREYSVLSLHPCGIQRQRV